MAFLTRYIQEYSQVFLQLVFSLCPSLYHPHPLWTTCSFPKGLRIGLLGQWPSHNTQPGNSYSSTPPFPLEDTSASCLLCLATPLSQLICGSQVPSCMLTRITSLESQHLSQWSETASYRLSSLGQDQTSSPLKHLVQCLAHGSCNEWTLLNAQIYRTTQSLIQTDLWITRKIQL